MSDEQVLDPRVAAWLHDGPTTASDWVARMVIDHVRDHPRRTPVGVRWGSVLGDLLRGRPTAASRRLAIALAAATLALALAGVGYLAWRQNVIVPPVPTSTPTASPSPSAQFECPPGTHPDEPGPADQLRPQPDSEWRAAVDADSGVMVVASGHEIWLFDLCTNTWRRSAATTSDGRVPVYDPNADLIVMLGSERVTTFDAKRDVATQLGPTPVVGQWEAVYDPIEQVIVVRDEGSSRLWAYRVADDEWRELAQAGDVPPAADPSCDIQLLSYDLAAQRLVLLHDPSWCFISGTTARTYEFDLGTGTWQKLSVATPASAVFDWGGPRMQIAYDPTNELSVIFDGRNVDVFDASAANWRGVFHRKDINAADGGLTHHRVPLAYDPINRRVVMLGGDPLARSDPAHANLGREQFQDVTAVDLATLTWTELLAGNPAQSAADVVDTSSDPIGDGGDADIGRVSTVVTDNTLELRIELQGGFGPDTLRREGHPDVWVTIYWNADNRRPPGAGGWADTCDPWLATYRTFIGPDGGVEAKYYEPVDQQVEIGEGLVTLTLSLASFDNPQVLGYAVKAGSDWAHDYVELPGCHWIPLAAGT